jgi:hypothetical protein
LTSSRLRSSSWATDDVDRRTFLREEEITQPFSWDVIAALALFLEKELPDGHLRYFARDAEGTIWKSTLAELHHTAQPPLQWVGVMVESNGTEADSTWMTVRSTWTLKVTGSTATTASGLLLELGKVIRRAEVVSTPQGQSLPPPSPDRDPSLAPNLCDPGFDVVATEPALTVGRLDVADPSVVGPSGDRLG